MAEATLLGEVSVTSNYVWRGITMSDDGPALIGGLRYVDDRWHLSGHVINVVIDDRNEQELIADAGYRTVVGEVRLLVGATYYEFVRGILYNPQTNSLQHGTSNDADFPEVYAQIGYGHVDVRYSYSDDYMGSGWDGHYYQIDFTIPITGEAELLLHYGNAESRAIDDHADDLSDFAGGIRKGPFSFVVTNLDDNEDGRQSRNPRYVLTWTESIEF